LLPAKAVNGDESLGAFVSRRLGREAYENLIEPLMSGIYAGDGDALSLASTFPYLRDLELKYGSLARGALTMRRQSNGKSVQGSRSAFLPRQRDLRNCRNLLNILRKSWLFLKTSSCTSNT
jgi:oxygen-dependent protoporphyrinogen oxidase